MSLISVAVPIGMIVVFAIAMEIYNYLDRGHWLEKPEVHTCLLPKLLGHKPGGQWQCNRCDTIWEITLVGTETKKWMAVSSILETENSEPVSKFR